MESKNLIQLSDLPEITFESVKERHALDIPDFTNRLQKLQKFFDYYNWKECNWKNPEEYGNIDSLIGNLPVKALQKIFTEEELAVIYTSRIFSKQHEDWEEYKKTPFIWTLEKCRMNFWHTQMNTPPWEDLKKVYNTFKNLKIEGFELFLDATYNFKTQGMATHHPEIHLDGGLGLMFHHKGEHVLTIGINLSYDRNNNLIFKIEQIQSAKKKGNRALFKLGSDWLNGAIHKLLTQIPKEFKVYQIEGKTASSNNRQPISLCLHRLKKGDSMYDGKLKEIQGMEDKLLNFDNCVGPRIEKRYNAPTKLFKRHFVPSKKAYLLKSA
jgi:hypothetical protein